MVNPYAEKLTFLDDRTRTRRDHMKYLSLIRTIALLHQHQRPVKTAEHQGQPVEYIEATLEDIAAANTLAHHVLGRCLDEMPPQTRRLLELIERMVAARCTERQMERSDVLFSRRELREFIGWGDTQLRVHLERLLQLEYLITHRGSVGQTFVYELVYDGGGKDGGRFLPGLLDVDRLRGRGGSGTLPHLAGVNGHLAGCSRGESGPFGAGSRGVLTSDSSSEKCEPHGQSAKNAHQDGNADAA